MLAFLALGLTTAHAQDDRAEAKSSVQEIVVYSDEFARWDKTRWFIVNELILPIPIAFARDFNWSFASYAFQIRAILQCEQTNQLSKKRLEADCLIEDVGILASTQRRQKGDFDRKLVAAVLDEVDDKLTGLKVQIQSDFRGGVQNVDLEGIETSNLRQRAIEETLRQVLLRMMSGFHLRIPDHAQRDGSHTEKASQIMQMPSTTASQGSSRLVHQVSVKDGYQVVQSVGEGTTRITIPVPRTVISRSQGGASAAGSSRNNSGINASVQVESEEIEGPVLIGLSGGAEAGLEANYALQASSVAVFQRETGIMTERIWTVQGVPSASSGGGGNRLPNYHTVGRLRILEKDERPDVGPSRQVAAPMQPIEGLPPWKPLETF